MTIDRTQRGVARGMAYAVAFAVPVFFAGALLFPSRLLPLVAAAATLFVVGRVAFFGGYAGGAPSRAFGFGLTFYPSVALLVSVIAVAMQTPY